MNDEYQEPSAREQSAPIGVVEMPAETVANRPFYAAIADLLPTPIAHTALVALFDYRATVGAINGWRYGRRSPPQWAIDILKMKGEARARRTLNNIARLSRARTTRTREEVASVLVQARRAKEKARREAGEV